MGTEQNLNNTAIIYARVSSVGQRNTGFSLDSQIRYLQEYAEEQNLKVVKVYEVPESAKKSGRIAFNQMLDFARKNHIKHLIFEKTDRSTRNFRDEVELQDLIQEGVSIHYWKEHLILNTNSRSFDKFNHDMRVVQSKGQIDLLTEEIKKGIAEKIRQGGYPSRAPVGYKNIRIKGRAEIEVDREKAPFIVKIFELASLGYPIESIRKIAIDDGFRIGNSKPTKSAIGKMLHNPLYCGKMRIKGVIYEGHHEPIISLELYNKVQKILTTNKSRQHDRIFPYVGLIKCGHCGCQLTAELKKGKYVYYHCTGKRGGTCKKDYIREEVIEETFKDLMQRIKESLSDEIIEAVKIALKESNKEKIEYQEAQYKEIQRQISVLDNRISKIYDDKLDGLISEEMWKKKTNDWHAEKDGLTLKLQNLNTSSKEFYEGSNLLFNFLKDAPRMYSEASPDKKKEILNFVGSNFTYKDKKVSVELTLVFDYLLNNPFLKKSGG